jgi:hypothetical protein
MTDKKREFFELFTTYEEIMNSPGEGIHQLHNSEDVWQWIEENFVEKQKSIDDKLQIIFKVKSRLKMFSLKLEPKIIKDLYYDLQIKEEVLESQKYNLTDKQ